MATAVSLLALIAFTAISWHEHVRRRRTRRRWADTHVSARALRELDR